MGFVRGEDETLEADTGDEVSVKNANEISNSFYTELA